MKITINGKDIELRKTMRSYIMYESITEKVFAPKTMTDMVTYFYCVVMSSQKDGSITFDEFIDWLDEHENAVSEFSQWLAQMSKVDADQVAKKKTRSSKAKTN